MIDLFWIFGKIQIVDLQDMAETNFRQCLFLETGGNETAFRLRQNKGTRTECIALQFQPIYILLDKTVDECGRFVI